MTNSHFQKLQKAITLQLQLKKRTPETGWNIHQNRHVMNDFYGMHGHLTAD